MKNNTSRAFMSPLFLLRDKRVNNVVQVNNGKDDLMSKLTDKTTELIRLISIST